MGALELCPRRKQRKADYVAMMQVSLPCIEWDACTVLSKSKHVSYSHRNEAR